MAEKSLVTVVYEILKENHDKGVVEPIAFGSICEEICIRLNMTEDQLKPFASRLYTDMTLDGRFVIKENNTWTLREYEKYADVHIDMNSVYTEEELESDERQEDSEDELDASNGDEDSEHYEDNYEQDDVVESDEDPDDNNN